MITYARLRVLLLIRHARSISQVVNATRENPPSWRWSMELPRFPKNSKMTIYQIFRDKYFRFGLPTPRPVALDNYQHQPEGQGSDIRIFNISFFTFTGV